MTLIIIFLDDARVPVDRRHGVMGHVRAERSQTLPYGINIPITLIVHR